MDKGRRRRGVGGAVGVKVNYPWYSSRLASLQEALSCWGKESVCVG